MNDKNNAAHNKDDPSHSEERGKESRIVNGLQKRPNDTSSEKAENHSIKIPKPSIPIRMWRGLWRRRSWRKIAGHPNSTLAEKIMAAVTVGLLFVGLIQAYIYWRQSVLMDFTLQQTERSIVLGRGQLSVAAQSVAQTRDQFLKDERPYVWTVQDEIPHVKLGEVVTWNFHYTNFGKSPAIGVAIRCQVRLAAHKTPELKNMYAPIHVPGFEYEGVIVPPNNSVNWTSCFSKEQITTDDLQLMNRYDGGIKLLIIFEYYDIGWQKYVSQVCFMTRRPNAGSLTAPCLAENKIK